MKKRKSLIEESTVISVVLGSITTFAVGAISFSIAYIFIYSFYLGNRKISINDIVSPIPFNTHALILIGTVIFTGCAMYVVLM